MMTEGDYIDRNNLLDRKRIKAGFVIRLILELIFEVQNKKYGVTGS